MTDYTPEQLAMARRIAAHVLCGPEKWKPDTVYTAIRSNAAGTKVIYTDAAGNEVTCWSDDWTMPGRREATASTLRAQAGAQS